MCDGPGGVHTETRRPRIGAGLGGALGLVLVLGFAPGLARAQSWYVVHGNLSADGVVVGQLYGGRVTPTSWASDTAPRVAYTDDVVSMEAELSLTDRDTYVSVGVGRAATVQNGSPFRIEMRALSWAPLLGRAGGGVRVALPPGLPASSGVLSRAVDAPSGADRPSSAFQHAGPPPAFDPACGALTIRPRPDARAPAWTTPGSAEWIQLGPERGGFTRAQVFVDGFVVHGWLQGAMPSCEGTIRLGDIGTACGDGFGTGIVVTLPAGTELYASRTASTPFGRLRADAIGVEPLHGPTGQGCANGVCRRVPAEPTGPAPWIVHAHAEGGGWLITAWVRTPAEQLARPTDPSSGFGGCWSPPSEWPRP